MKGELGRLHEGRYTSYLVQEMVRNRAHWGKLGLGKGGRGTRGGCKEVEECQGLGQRYLQRQILQRHRKARHGNSNSKEGLIQKHICQVPVAHVFGGFLWQQPEAKGEANGEEGDQKVTCLRSARRLVGQHSWLRCLFPNKISLSLPWLKNCLNFKNDVKEVMSYFPLNV